MKRILATLLVVATVGLAGCRKEPVKVISEYESGELAAQVYNFQVYPGAKFLRKQSELIRKAYYVMNPGAKVAPGMAMYVTDAPLEKVAEYYRKKAGWLSIAPFREVAGSIQTEHAYFHSGDLGVDARGIATLLPKLGITTDLSKVSEPYRAAHIDSNGNLPRFDIQRPWLDLLTGKVHDQTLILMVRE